jgi:hypothetical protein
VHAGHCHRCAFSAPAPRNDESRTGWACPQEKSSLGLRWVLLHNHPEKGEK